MPINLDPDRQQRWGRDSSLGTWLRKKCETARDGVPLAAWKLRPSPWALCHAMFFECPALTSYLSLLFFFISHSPSFACCSSCFSPSSTHLFRHHADDRACSPRLVPLPVSIPSLAAVAERACRDTQWSCTTAAAAAGDGLFFFFEFETCI